MRTRNRIALCLLLCAGSGFAQIDQQRAAQYFKEAAALCAREGGRLWGVSLCGPMVFADPKTRTIATNQPAPDAPRPTVLGFANTALNWGGTRWTTIVWPMIPANERARGRLMLHELFHRIQPELGFLVREGNNDHLDTLEGRFWMQLEWRALARALAASGAARDTALRDALAFRAARRKHFSSAAENEQLLEINEGLAQYTGTAAAFPSPADAAVDAIQQLEHAAKEPSFVRTFAYASGAAYGLLLDAAAPGWTRSVKPASDLGQLLAAARQLAPSPDADAAAARYGGPELRAAEEKLDAERKLRIAELRRRFVDGPVLTIPAGGSASFVTTGMTPIPGAGTVYPSFRVTATWGSLEAAAVLWSTDRSTLVLPAPANPEGSTIKGEGYTLTITPGWSIRPGARPGDFRLARDSGGSTP